MEEKEIAVIGGGAAGFFSAISAKTFHPLSNVTIYEKSGKLLSKVSVSGGGRCNLTHACFSNTDLAKNYPRGAKQLKKAFQYFNVSDTVQWFETRGVKLKTEPDNRMFPETDSSQTIVDCLLREAKKHEIAVLLNSPVIALKRETEKFELVLKGGEKVTADKIIVATGGSPKPEGLKWLEALGHTVSFPVPSLFTFNMPNEAIKSLMGVVADPVTVKVQSSKLVNEGPVLITHWGMSGPAILKLSAWGARELYEKNYHFNIHLNWLGQIKEEKARETLQEVVVQMHKKKVMNHNPFKLPNRLWLFLLAKAEIEQHKIWADLGKKAINKLINILVNDEYEVYGKTTFKEEFVTCGGVSLNDVSFSSMESKRCPGLYFAGEVLDIDGITGGFNFQAAWTTGFIAGKLMSEGDIKVG